MRNLVVVIEYKWDSTDRRYRHWSQPFVPPDGEIEELLIRRHREPLVPIKGIPSDASFAVVADVKECGADMKHPTWLTPDEWERLLAHCTAIYDGPVHPEFEAISAVLRILPNARLVCWFLGK